MVRSRIFIFATALLATGWLAGCSTVIESLDGGAGFGASTPAVDKTNDPSYSRFNHPEISTEDIRVYEYNPDGGELPEGVYYGHEGQLVFEEAYPTAKAVVRQAAELEAQSHEDYSAEAIREGLLKAAAEVRANHLVVNAKEGIGFAIFMPDVEPTPVERNPDVHLEREAKEAADSGYTDHVDTRRISLESPAPLRLDTEAGDCHAIVIALDKDADFNWAARQRLRTEFSHPDPYIDEKLANNPSFETTSAGTEQVRSRRARGAWTSLGCVVKDGELVVKFLPDFVDESDQGNTTSQPALGTGELIVKIYREPGTSAEAIKAERQQAEEEAERRNEKYTRQRCRECVEDHRCHMRDPDAMCDSFRICVERSAIDLADCRKRGITP
jgi:hypothetical protein